MVGGKEDREIRLIMDLKALLHSATSQTPDESDVRELIFICKKIALVFLRKKTSAGQLCRDFSPLRLEDLALDCIADLFSRDEHGSLIQIRLYFEGLPIENSSEEELLSHLRRLVFARTNQSIFRIYHEADPSLSKILRNLKIAIQSLQNFIVIERFGNHCITPALCESLEHLPQFDRDELEQLLRDRLSCNDSIPSMLAKVSVFLREQTNHSRVVPCILIAQIIRAIYETPLLEAGKHFAPAEIPGVDDARNILLRVCTIIKKENLPHYVGGKKVLPTVFETYFAVILENLLQRFVMHNGDDFSFFDRLRSRIPDLTKEEYRVTHKSKLEYLARLTYDRAITELRKDL